MTQNDPANHQFQLAVQFVNHTSQHLFITGKAGTGKTTFLKYIKENCFKNLAILAPTGVAAIHAGGVTIHSMFQLPFGPFLPTKEYQKELSMKVFSDQTSIFQNMRYSLEKRELLQSLELLIIDEVSMVRSDTIDAIDTVLRRFRNRPYVPFGGVQMIYIGDLFQLPPVVGSDDWQLMSRFYKSPFFFDSFAVQQAPPVYLELKKIYRQTDVKFISLLNNIRNNKVVSSDFELLENYYMPGFQPAVSGEFITLCSHNAKADIINQEELQKILGKPTSFECEIKGEFNERALPAERVLHLKKGAQVMFIKNDKGESRRYYNGKIATISRIESGSIFVRFPGSEEEMWVEKEVWRNIRYEYNKANEKIEEVEIGSFVQYPIRLAWAITVHKSQGLTFEKAIVDVGEAFAPGQVYVALSRLTSIQGLVLYSRIPPSSIKTDERVVAFSLSEQSADVMEMKLQQEKKRYIANSMVEAFGWNRLVDNVSLFLDEFQHRKIPLQNEAIICIKSILEASQKQQIFAEKFIHQLDTILPVAEEDGYNQVYSRVSAAVVFFQKALETEIVQPLEKHFETMKNQVKTKGYLKEVFALLKPFKRKINQINQALDLSKGLKDGLLPDQLLVQVEEGNRLYLSISENEDKLLVPELLKPAKGETKFISLRMFKEGNSVAEIAEARKMSPVTIEGHLASFIITGEIEILQLVSESKLTIITETIASLEEASSATIKEKLGSEYSYADIKAVQAHIKRTSDILADKVPF